MSIRVFSQRAIITPAPLPRRPINPLGTVYLHCGERCISTQLAPPYTISSKTNRLQSDPLEKVRSSLTSPQTAKTESENIRKETKKKFELTYSTTKSHTFYLVMDE